MVHDAVEDHRADVLWEKLGVGRAKLRAIREAQPVQLGLAQADTDCVEVPGRAGGVNETEERAGQIEAGLAQLFVEVQDFLKGGFVVDEVGRRLFPEAAITFHPGGQTDTAGVWADEVEVSHDFVADNIVTLSLREAYLGGLATWTAWIDQEAAYPGRTIAADSRHVQGDLLATRIAPIHRNLHLAAVKIGDVDVLTICRGDVACFPFYLVGGFFSFCPGKCVDHRRTKYGEQ